MLNADAKYRLKYASPCIQISESKSSLDIREQNIICFIARICTRSFWQMKNSNMFPSFRACRQNLIFYVGSLPSGENLRQHHRWNISINCSKPFFILSFSCVLMRLKLLSFKLSPTPLLKTIDLIQFSSFLQ